MKSHFIRLLSYDRFANHQTANLLVHHNAAGKPVSLLAHILAAQNIWLGRLKSTPPVQPVVLWPEWSINEIIPMIDANHQALVAHVSTLEFEDFERVISYKNSVGYFETSVADILTHVANHGTHHRAQIGSLLKVDGATLPILDYVFYLRTLNKTEQQ